MSFGCGRAFQLSNAEAKEVIAAGIAKLEPETPDLAASLIAGRNGTHTAPANHFGD